MAETEIGEYTDFNNRPYNDDDDDDDEILRFIGNGDGARRRFRYP